MNKGNKKIPLCLLQWNKKVIGDFIRPHGHGTKVHFPVKLMHLISCLQRDIWWTQDQEMSCYQLGLFKKSCHEFQKGSCLMSTLLQFHLITEILLLIFFVEVGFIFSLFFFFEFSFFLIVFSLKRAYFVCPSLLRGHHCVYAFLLPLTWGLVCHRSKIQDSFLYVFFFFPCNWGITFYVLP